MIITGNRALQLISNHGILGAVPELLAAVEAFAAANRKWQPKKGCPDCDKGTAFADVETEALQAFAGLPPDAVQRLRTFLGRNDLYVNLPQPGKSAVVRELK